MRGKEEGTIAKDSSLLPICDLKRKAEPQTNRASIVNSLLRITDIVATKVEIGIHIDNDKLARLDINIEIAEQCEGGIERRKERMIEHVVEIRANLQPLALTNFEKFVNTEIHTPSAGPGK